MAKQNRRHNRERRIPNYLIQILANPPLSGTVGIAHVYHDSDCAIWQGGRCDCYPEVVYEYRRELTHGHNHLD